MSKNMPHPGPSSGTGRGKGLGAHVFRGPGVPVTNSIQLEGKWYGNPDSYSRRFPDSPQAAILFSSRHPQSEEAKIYSDRSPATTLFLNGPPPGFTVSTPSPQPENTWVQVTKKGAKGKKAATAAQVAASSKSSIPTMPPLLPTA